MNALDAKRHLTFLSRSKNLHYRHWTEVGREIEPGIMPLVLALDNQVVTPIFSCEGHWDRRTEPYVMFLVLKGQSRNFQRILHVMMNPAADGLASDYQIFHRFRPKRAGNGPFDDWKLTIDIPYGRIKAEAEFFRERDARVTGVATLLVELFNIGLQQE